MKAGWSSQWCQLWCLLGALVCAGVCAAKPRILEIQIMFSARLLPALPPFLARLHKITSKFGKTINTLTLSDDVFPSQFLTAPIGSSSSDEATFCCVLCVLVEWKLSFLIWDLPERWNGMEWPVTVVVRREISRILELSGIYWPSDVSDIDDARLLNSSGFLKRVLHLWEPDQPGM